MVEAGAGIVTRGIIQKIKQDLFVVRVWEEGMWGGIILPEGTQVADLPAFDGLGWGLVASIWGELAGQSPAANTGPVSFEVEPAMQFAGGGAVGGGRFGGEEFGQQLNHRRRPPGLMIAAGETGRPDRRLALSTGPQVLAVELVEAGSRQAEFTSCGHGGKPAAAMTRQEMANDWCWESFDEL